MKALAFAFFFGVTAFTAAGQVGEATPAPAESVAPKRYQLKTKSSFKIPADTRAPFIPIGWVKPKEGEQVIVISEDKIDESAFRVTTILLGNPSLAVINGQSYQEGEFLRMPRGGPQLRILVHRIADGQVLLQHEKRVFAAPLKRPELGERTVEEPLLNAERFVVPMPATPTPAPKPKP